MSFINTIAPILIVAFIGYGLVKASFLSNNGFSALSKLSFTVLIPAMLFLGISHANIEGVVYGQYIAGYFIPVFVVFALGCITGYAVFRLNSVDQSVFAVASAYSNATILGLPICLYALGDASLVPMSVIVAFHNFFLFSIGLISAERGGYSIQALLAHLKRIIINFVTNPITLSLIAGFIVNITHISLPNVVLNSLEMLANAAVPVAFLVLGGSMAAYGIRGDFLKVSMISALKLFLLPLLVWISQSLVFDFDDLWTKTAVLIAAAPVGVASHVYAQKYNRGENMVASSILLSTIVSVFSLSFWLNWLN